MHGRLPGQERRGEFIGVALRAFFPIPMRHEVRERTRLLRAAICPVHARAQSLGLAAHDGERLSKKAAIPS
jgi:hypothetical protein